MYNLTFFLFLGHYPQFNADKEKLVEWQKEPKNRRRRHYSDIVLAVALEVQTVANYEI